MVNGVNSGYVVSLLTKKILQHALKFIDSEVEFDADSNILEMTLSFLKLLEKVTLHESKEELLIIITNKMKVIV